MGLGWGAEGVLGLKDVGWEMHLEDFETPAKVAWVRGLGGSTFSLRERAREYLRNMGM